jgi:hypothetical protein
MLKIENTPTAEEFFGQDNGLYTAYGVKDKEGKFQSVCSYEKAIEFAKIHVEAALKKVYQKSRVKISPHYSSRPVYLVEERLVREFDGTQIWVSVSEDSIMNCYPLDNIK